MSLKSHSPWPSWSLGGGSSVGRSGYSRVAPGGTSASATSGSAVAVIRSARSETAVLDDIGQGRVDLIVVGSCVREEFALFGVPLNERAKRVTEVVTTLKSAFTGEPFSYRGRTVRVTPAPYRPGGPYRRRVRALGSGRPRTTWPRPSVRRTAWRSCAAPRPFTQFHPPCGACRWSWRGRVCGCSSGRCCRPSAKRPGTRRVR
ncbi:LLM class flavin-dependent oxidoreductase [Streptomyces hokutonensis]|uniref:LLM class flavin-dependent oxidoreductase n=1 Tax=Streptomyces hokutonensis TaxID=1306990 RepID=UPI0036A0E1CE